MKTEKVVVVKRRTQLEELLIRHSTTSQAKFYLEKAGHSYKSYEEAHRTYKSGIDKTLDAIPKNLRSQIVDKNELATLQFGNSDLIVVVGDDGLLVNVAKYVGSQLIISVNPDEKRFDGILSSCNVDSFPNVLKKVYENNAELQYLTMAEAILDDGQKIRALNDLFVGRKTHMSARYLIEYNEYKEQQSSSGIIVSTGTGSTGWMTSVVTGANAIANKESRLNSDIPFGKSEDYLIFAVREPFLSKITGTNIVYGKITKDNPLKIESNMPEEGVIFSDGIEKDYLEFTSGRTAIIRPSENKVCLVRNRE